MTGIQERIEALGCLVGHTPLVAVDLLYRGRPRRLYAKAEQFNLTGSIKDRMALHILRRAHETGALAPGAPIGEATSGNTGISFSALGTALGHPVTIFMPDWMSQERKDLIRSFGAEVRLVSAVEGGFLGSIRLSEEWAASTPGAFLPRQFANEANVEAHAATTGPEIWAQLAFLGLKPHAFVAGVGTGGTVMGTGRYLKEQDPSVRVHPVEPANSPTLHTGHKVGKHRIQGISDEFIPAIVKLDQLDEIVSVDDGDAILVAQRLARHGLGVGISSGANLLAALQVQEKLGPDAVVVTVFSDSNKKYLSTDLTRDEPVREGSMARDVELTGMAAVVRHCPSCGAGQGIG
ncbi:MAG: cysteine synthase family protein [Thermoanaerobaculia bacterium]|nr:cysteine synthase family protein [Thermoanaerobaculia bacterium]